MEEYQSLLRGVELKSEEQLKSEQEIRDIEANERERGRRAIAILNKIEHELARIDMSIEFRGYDNIIILPMGSRKR